MTGRILKGIGGFYYVQSKSGSVYECKARGRFRKEGITPLPGDWVEFTVDANDSGYIEEINKRKNELLRPRVTNVNMLAIVASAGKPNIDKLLCDKLIIEALRAKVKPLLVINKCDTVDYSEALLITKEYEKVCDTICVSAVTKQGLEDFKDILKDKCTCFAGQSAAGKSSLLNSLFSGLDLETGSMSKKTDRGRHTTRHAQLLVLGGFDGTAVDTPGFTYLETEELRPAELSLYYPDFKPYSDRCRFTSCLHDDEPDCGIKEALEKGFINAERYQRYKKLLKEIYEKRQRKYD